MKKYLILMMVLMGLTTSPTLGVYLGPDYPPPGGVDWAPSGIDPGEVNGLNWNYTNFDFATGNIASLYWAPIDGGIKITLEDLHEHDHSYTGQEILQFSTFPTSSSARWIGTSTLKYRLNPGDQWSIKTVDTRYTVTLSGNASWINPGPPPAGINGHNGAVAIITGDFTANLFAEANFPDANGSWIWGPINEDFNDLETDYYTASWFESGFWYEPDPNAVTVYQPNGSEQLLAGSTYEIIWDAKGGIADVKIEYSVDEGDAYKPIAVAADTGLYDWTVPDDFSAECLVRISDACVPEISDTSDDVFIIYECRKEYEFATEWGENGTGDGQFSTPWGIAMDSSGLVYVADYDNHRVQVFGPNEATGSYDYITQWGEWGNGDGQFIRPVFLAVDTLGYVYVCDNQNYRVQVFEPNQTSGSYDYVTQWGDVGAGDGEFNLPQGIAVDSSELVYVADTDNHRIQVFEPNQISGGYDYIAQWGGLGTGDGQFTHPWGIAVNSSGHVYVADCDNHRIQVFEPNEAGGYDYVAQWGELGSGDSQFVYPQGIAVDSSGRVYVADSGNNRIQKFTSDGTLITKWGSGPGSGEGEFDRPLGVAVDSLLNAYVTDYYNDRVQKFSPVLSLTWDLTGPQGIPDCIVNFVDVAGLASEWLDCGNPFDEACQ